MNRAHVSILCVAVAVLCAGVAELVLPAQASNCPSGAGCGCSTAYAPVICKGHCRYTNMCHATCAGFTSSDCKSVNN